MLDSVSDGMGCETGAGTAERTLADPCKDGACCEVAAECRADEEPARAAADGWNGGEVMNSGERAG